MCSENYVFWKKILCVLKNPYTHKIMFLKTKILNVILFKGVVRKYITSFVKQLNTLQKPPHLMPLYGILQVTFTFQIFV